MDEPIAIVFRRRVRAGREGEYERWLEAMQRETRGFPGYLGVQTVKPPSGRREYVSMLRFESMDALEAWERSDLRTSWLSRLPSDCVEGEPEVRKAVGVEAWFASDDVMPALHPVRWKMALVLATVVYGLILILGPLVAFSLESLGLEVPLQVRLLITVVIEVTLMTWVVMPRVTRLLEGWLYRP